MRQIKSGSFWFMVLFPFIMMLVSLGIGGAAGSFGDEMAIVAEPEIAEHFKDNPNYDFRITSEDELDKLLDDKEISSFAKIKDEDGLITAEYMPGSSGMSQELTLQNILEQIQTEINEKNADLSQDQVETLAKSPVINKINLEKEDNKTAGMIIYYVLLFLMYMILLTFINVVLAEVATEKGTKMIEFIFSSVRPGDYFAGKMLGNFLAVLTEIVIYVIIAIGGFIIAKTNGLLDNIPIDFSMGGNMIGMMAEIVLLFLLGIFIYLIVAGMLGSFATKVEDAGKMGFPIIFVIIIFFALAIRLMNKGDVMASKVLSYIPFASTFFMPLRLLNGYAGLTEGAISIVILIISIFLMYKFGEKIYKKNILNYSSDNWLTRRFKK
ncbi:ABC transporter permease [uncultured Anaerococcus sp.]|uniref:ABC transporter permease n=1 Tax=uncultured Anaerococcus sp. TaxID=293428 RepID=UPI0026084D25|nr:ABC transporter permease [uncultured Anaerococcus sp.]